MRAAAWGPPAGACWAYSGRTGNGNANQTNAAYANYINAPQEMQVYFGGQLVATNTWGGTPSGGGDAPSWIFNTFIIEATSSTEVLSFESIYLGGNVTYGDEVTDVSLIPEPPGALVLLTGVSLLAGARRRRIRI